MKARNLLFIAAVACLPMIASAEVRVIGPTSESDDVSLLYKSHFEDGHGAGPEWSRRRTDVTPVGNRAYLGGFVEEPVDLSLTKLPQHKLVRITFDLYLLRCWDGSSKIFGVKIWNLDVLGKQNLIHTTFSNAGFFSDNNEQAFPDTYPCRPLPAWTGAAEKQTLGTIMSWGTKERTWDSSGVYHFELTFPHDEKDITFRFSSLMEGKKDKSYGLANVKVETLANLTRPTDESLDEYWKKLGGVSATDAYDALWKLAPLGDQITSYVEKHLKDPADATEEQMKKWADMLASNLDAEVQAGYAGLVSQGKNAAKLVDEAVKAGGDAVYARRVNLLARYIADYPETATELRDHRVRQLLKIINSKDSLKLAETIKVHDGEDKPVPMANERMPKADSKYDEGYAPRD